MKTSFIFLYLFFFTISSESFYEKPYPNIGRVGYHCEYLGTVSRKYQPTKSENLISPDRIPTYNSNKDLSDNEKQSVLKESELIISSTSSYTQIDQNGYLYLNNNQVKYANGTARKLYKHIGSTNNYGGSLSDKEPAVIKRITYTSISPVYAITGLYAPPGEVVSIQISEKDIEKVQYLYISIGQVFESGKLITIKSTRDFIRMPTNVNTFKLFPNMKTATRKGTDYVFYIGSFLGGPIFIKPHIVPSSYTVTIRGAVRYANYVHGYTTPEEFEENWKSTAPYLDVEVWQRGIRLSGPKSLSPISKFDDFYKIGVYWEKVTSISTQFPAGSDIYKRITIYYDCYITMSGAYGVAYSTEGNSFILQDVFQNALDIEYLETVGAYTVHHELNHHFQKNWGLTNDDEGSNDAITLVEYSLFTRVSATRGYFSKFTRSTITISTNYQFTYAHYVLKNLLQKKASGNMYCHSMLLHNFGQEIFIKAAQKQYGQNNDAHYRAYTELTGFDLTYLFKDICQISISDEVVNQFASKNYPTFIPIACIYQTGVGYMIKGKRNEIHTMTPYVISCEKELTMDFNKEIIIPDGYTFTIKSITNPANGTLTKIDENIYKYTPDDKSTFSGKITLTVGIQKSSQPNLKINDVEIYIEIQTSYHALEHQTPQFKLNKRIYTYDEDKMQNDPVKAFKSGYSGASSYIDLKNDQSSCMTIMDEVKTPNSIAELRGIMDIYRTGKQRIALDCKKHCALFLSFDEGKNYELAVNYTHEKDTLVSATKDPNRYHEYELEQSQKVYFKAVLNLNIDYNGENPTLEIAIGREEAGSVWESCPHTILDYLPPDPPLVSETNYPRVWTEKRIIYYPFTQKLVNSSYTEFVEKGTEDSKYKIENLFDENEENFILTNQSFTLIVNNSNSVMVNRIVISGPAKNSLPNSFLLYGGTDLDNLQLLSDGKNTVLKNNDLIISFSTREIQYYKLKVTDILTGSQVSLSSIKLSFEIKGTMISVDDNRVALFNSWKKVSKLSTFGSIYEGSQNSKIVFKFKGKQFCVNAFKSSKYDKFKITVENTEKIVNLNASLNKVSTVFISDVLSNAEHEVTIEGIGSYNVDSFLIRDDSVEPLETIEDTGSLYFTKDDSITDDDNNNPGDDNNNPGDDNNNPGDDNNNPGDDNNNPGDDSSHPDDDNNSPNESNNSNKKKVVVISVIAAIVVVVIVIVIVIVIVVRKKRADANRLSQNEVEMLGNENDNYFGQ